MNPGLISIDPLSHRVSSLAAAAGPSDVFRLLLEGARLAGPRAAMFLVRKGAIKGWGSVGYPAEVAAQQRAFTSPADAGWLGELSANAEVGVEHHAPIASDPAFGQTPASETAASALRVKGRTISLLVIERSADEQLWHPAALGLLVEVARLRLDLDLAQRKMEAAGQVVASPPVTAPVAPTPIAAQPPVEIVEIKEIAPVAEATPALSPEMQAVHRFAKLVATDIRLYNEEAVMLGRRNRDLAKRLGEQLARGKETFQRRYGSVGAAGIDILHKACVQVLAGGEEELLPASLFESQPTT
jgi:hypothetical protein